MKYHIIILDISTLTSVLLFLEVITIVLCHESESNVENHDLQITYQENLALEKLRERDLRILPHEYMKTDIFLLRFLRRNNYDVGRASNMLHQVIKWRAQHKMDQILQEDFSDVNKPVHIDTYSKNGSPVITVKGEDLDLRKLFATGKSERAQRCALRVIEEASVKVRQARDEGKNVTRFHFVWDMKGFDLQKQACPQCLAQIVNTIKNYERYYPGMADRVVVFNASPRIKSIGPIVRSTLSGRTRGHITLLGSNRNEWRKHLLKFIDEEQLTTDFGGTRIRNN